MTPILRKCSWAPLGCGSSSSKVRIETRCDVDGELYIQKVIDSNVVHRLIDFLDERYGHRLQFEACWCLTNIATGTAENIQCITEKGAVPIFVKLMASEYKPLRDQVLIYRVGDEVGGLGAGQHRGRELGVPESRY